MTAQSSSVPRTALLVLDLQAFFQYLTITAGLNTTLIAKLTSSFSDLGIGPVIFTQHGHPPSDFEAPVTNQLVRKWGKEHSIHYGSKDWRLIPDIEQAREQLLVKQKDGVSLPEQEQIQKPQQKNGQSAVLTVEKNTYDAFLNTGLEEKLKKEHKVERVLVCGVLTDCCVETTACSAFNRGFETWILSDACACDGDSKRTFDRFEDYFGDIVTMEQALVKLRGVEQNGSLETEPGVGQNGSQETKPGV